MILKSVALKNFRNYRDLYLEFDTGTNILFGDNAVPFMSVALLDHIKAVKIGI